MPYTQFVESETDQNYYEIIEKNQCLRLYLLFMYYLQHSLWSHCPFSRYYYLDNALYGEVMQFFFRNSPPISFYLRAIFRYVSVVKL